MISLPDSGATPPTNPMLCTLHLKALQALLAVNQVRNRIIFVYFYMPLIIEMNATALEGSCMHFTIEFCSQRQDTLGYAYG